MLLRENIECKEWMKITKILYDSYGAISASLVAPRPSPS